jgi:hypothetical protein
MRDTRCKPGQPLPEIVRKRIEGIARQLVKRLEL